MLDQGSACDMSNRKLTTHNTDNSQEMLVTTAFRSSSSTVEPQELTVLSFIASWLDKFMHCKICCTNDIVCSKLAGHKSTKRSILHKHQTTIKCRYHQNVDQLSAQKNAVTDNQVVEEIKG